MCNTLYLNKKGAQRWLRPFFNATVKSAIGFRIALQSFVE